MADSTSSGARFTAAAQAGRKRKRVTAIIVIAIICAGVAGLALSAMREPAVPGAQYRTETVKKGTFTAQVSADGQSMPVRSVPVFAKQGGTVSRLEVERGDQVDAGQVLYVLENPALHTKTLQLKASLEAQRQQRKQADQGLASARYALAQADATQLQAQQNLAALHDLPATATHVEDQIDLAEKQLTAAKRGVASARAAVESAEAGVVAARSAVSAAQDAYAQALADEEDLVVVSPISGVVTTMGLAEGQAVTAGTGATPGAQGESAATIVVAAGEELKVRIAISERDRGRVEEGQSATVTFDSRRGEEVSATISWIAPDGTNAQGVVSYEGDVVLAERPDWLERGMSASVDITTGLWPDAFTVSNAAVKIDGTDKYVIVLMPDGSTKKVGVKTGLTSGGVTHILSGLKAGDVVVLGPKGAGADGASGSSVPNPLNPGASF